MTTEEVAVALLVSIVGTIVFVAFYDFSVLEKKQGNFGISFYDKLPF